MASQHHDDVSVACVDDKCLVLGFSQYCRYKQVFTCMMTDIQNHYIKLESWLFVFCLRRNVCSNPVCVPDVHTSRGGLPVV